MANSRFEYVRQFERDVVLLPHTWLVLRVDGNAFSDFVKEHNWNKPIDQRGAAAVLIVFLWIVVLQSVLVVFSLLSDSGVDLMVACARALCEKFRDVRMA